MYNETIDTFLFTGGCQKEMVMKKHLIQFFRDTQSWHFCILKLENKLDKEINQVN